jgi:hypothetical protein
MAPINRNCARFAAAASEALTAPLPGRAGPWCEAKEGGDPSPFERTEFWEFGDQGSGDGFSDAGTDASSFSFSTQTVDRRI